MVNITVDKKKTSKKLAKKTSKKKVKKTNEYKQKTKIATNKWRKNNPEKFQKSQMISKWRKRGVIETWYYTFDILYDWYMKTTHCENCNIQLTNDKKRKPTTKCLHHIHETGEFEMIVCHSCNVRLK